MSFFLYSVTFLLCSISLYLFLKLTRNRWLKFNIPSVPGRLPVFGHVLPAVLGRRSVFALCEDMYQTYNSSSMCGFYYMNKPALLLRDPEVVKSVLLTNFQNFQVNGVTVDPRADPILARHPSFTSGEPWKVSRSRLINHFSGKKLGLLFNIVNDVVNQFSSFIERKIQENQGAAEFELKELFSRYTGEIVANSAFGIEGQSFRDQPDPDSFTEMAKIMFLPSTNEIIGAIARFYLPELANLLRLEWLPKKAENYYRNALRTIIQNRKKSNQKQNDFLQFILDHDDDGSGNYDEDLIVTEVITFYADVYETSSITLSFFLHRLANEVEVQDKLRAEVRDALKTSNGELTYELVKGLSYLDKALAECLRLNSPVATLMKVCNKKTTLRGSDGLSCEVEPGNMMFIPITSLHLDEKYWENPEIYDPERFENRTGDKFTFLPFSEGPRMCVGKRMGMMVVKLAVARLINDFYMQPSLTRNEFEIDPQAVIPIMQYAKDGIYAGFRKLDKQLD